MQRHPCCALEEPALDLAAVASSSDHGFVGVDKILEFVSSLKSDDDWCLIFAVACDFLRGNEATIKGKKNRYRFCNQKSRHSWAVLQRKRRHTNDVMWLQTFQLMVRLGSQAFAGANRQTRCQRVSQVARVQRLPGTMTECVAPRLPRPYRRPKRLRGESTAKYDD